ncbi:dolichyl-phosphate-mannose--protein mannosyltransferase [Acinetobacter sp. ANC 3903]|uniref:ArnT family glycosyltransferase n=1 Tax=Acinetobacter sp. ANC 3903 TaxID=1977883 RepID=UPI000A357756|nr:glycosyltransferase family 39 protein [Acinetobacter sp. ANC 3903]OTG64426.1 dolichyl-phosphate-mannose--protein mannosyltransferase [Acinetobacter sp. ANC 3903]
MKPLFRSSKLMLWCISIWLIACAGIRYFSLPDEGRYGDISRAMLQSGDWLVPRLNGLPFMHKPPLLHWISSVLMEIFGVHVWVLRLVPTLAGIMMLVGLFWFLKKHCNERIAQLSVVILATSLLFFGSSQYVNHDLLLACWISITILCFADFTLSGEKSVLWMGYVACALGFLTKGLIGILIPGMVILLWVLANKQWKKIPSLLNPIGLIIFCVIALPWVYLMHLKYPAFLQYFFIDQQFSRFSSDQFNNKLPWPFYLLCLLISFLPWFFVSQFKFSKQDFSQSLGSSILTLMLIWFVSVTTFFSIPPSKLAGYILPATPPLAVFIAIMVDRVLTSNKINRFQTWATPVLVLVVGLAFISLPFTARPKNLLYVNITALYSLGAGILIFSILLIFYYLKQRISYFSLMFSMAIILCMSVSLGVRILDVQNNANQVSFQKNITANMPIVFYHNYFYDVPFLLNLQKPVYLVDDWENASQDSSSEQLKDGLIFEPERRQYLWSDSILDQKIESGEALVVLARSNSFNPHYANVQVLHYRNYDVYFFNNIGPVQK